MSAHDSLDTPDSCMGKDGTGGCRFVPRYVVGGDLACSYHLTSAVKLRTKEVDGEVKVEPYKGPGTWGGDDD